MTFFVDECVEKPIADRLRADGCEVVLVAEMRPRASDDLVLSMANARGAVLVTNDKDFGKLVFRDRWTTTGILLLRLAGHSLQAKADIVSAAVRGHGHEMPGAFTVVSPGPIRIRRRL